MPTLDPIADNPLHTGPTVDWEQERSMPLERDEPFQIRARNATASLKRQPKRPPTARPTYQISAGHTRVLAKNANQNPDAMGTDAVTSDWQLSDPDQLAADQAAETRRNLLMVGGLIGVLAVAGYFCFSRK
jgi:hypothetical protein